MKNKICELFSIKYPIIQAGMVWCSGWKLASEVSNSGGLGIIGLTLALTYVKEAPSWLTFDIHFLNTNQNSFIVNVQTDRVGDAILQKIDLSNEIIDTTNIKNGKFSFKKNINEEELYRLKFFDGTSFDILANSGENISINYIWFWRF